MNILGISSYYHDSAACILKNGEIVAAIQEERLTRIKHDAQFPANAIAACLSAACMKAEEIDKIVFFEKPFLKFERLLETYLAFAPRGLKSFLKAIPIWLEEKIFQKKLIKEELITLGFTLEQVKELCFSDHHLSHAASAFYPSPFFDAVVLTIDGVGEWATTSVYLGKGNVLELKRKIHFPHSLGLLYSAFTGYCGFKVNSGEYKLMGLAPYGKPIYAEVIKNNLIDIKNDGSHCLNMDYFNYCTGLTMTNDKFNKLFGNNFRRPEEELKQVHMDIAASIQIVIEEVLLKICSDLKLQNLSENLCLAGGVALNCVANGKILKSGLFKNVWIQPAAGDAGGALGAALALFYQGFNHKRDLNDCDDGMKGSFLGTSYNDHEIESALNEFKFSFKRISDEEVSDFVASELAIGKTVGWFQGRMEFGPRSLGCRSILADPRDPNMQKKLNLQIKFRESFRPFAPAILEDKVKDYFPVVTKSPYMLQVDFFKEEHHLKNRSELSNLSGMDLLNVPKTHFPAVTHVDFSARIQTVSKETNPRFYELITSFYQKTNCPMLVNTSFNVRGEPIVCSPRDAIKCFLGTGLSLLVLNNYIVDKENVDKSLLFNYENQFQLD